MHAAPAKIHSLARAEFDRGEADPGLPLRDMMLLLKPSAAQQADLDTLLIDQQNPASPLFHKWLTPDQFGERFGVSVADHSRIVAWLTARGLRVTASATARNWVSFDGSAGTVAKALNTSIHRFEVGGKTHFSVTRAPELPLELAEMTEGLVGLDDFLPESQLRGYRSVSEPEYTSGGNHYLSPADFSTIYNVGPLNAAGLDGTGQSIAVVGQSAIQLSDIRSFRTRFGLPSSDPKILLFGADPGFNGAEVEGDLDVQWTGAIAPKATIYYVYGTNAFTAILNSISLNVAPIISISYGSCEINVAIKAYRTFFQQANAQGITLVAASGDSGASGCEAQGVAPFAAKGRYVDFPAVAAEVTAVGGTQFNEGTGSWWSAANSTILSSALSYIPETVWNESGPGGLLASGGGASALEPKPAWQAGRGVPADGARDVPDISLSGAVHDPYLIYNGGSLGAVGGTSASAPSLAGILARLNQYLVAQKVQATAGLGNVNPQIYRMAETTPDAFHDIVDGNNNVPCLQAAPGCLTGQWGYSAGPGYDLATGVGSIDAQAFVTKWNQSGKPVKVSLVVAPSPVTLNDTIALFATVAPADGNGVPKGKVNFSTPGVAFGSSALVSKDGQLTASLIIPAYLLFVGANPITAAYSGDDVYSGGAALATARVNLPPATVSAVTVAAAQNAFALPNDEQGGPIWQTTITFTERNGVAALLTGYALDGVDQTLSDSFPSQIIPARGTLSSVLTFRGQTPGSDHVLTFTGTDSSGTSWTRQDTVSLLVVPVYSGFRAEATPLVVAQNPAAPAGCQWQQQVVISNTFGYRLFIRSLFSSDTSFSNQIVSIFGTERLEAYSQAIGTLCWKPAQIPSVADLFIGATDDPGRTLSQDIIVNFTGPIAGAPALTAAPNNISLSAPIGVPIPPSAQLNINPGPGQRWTAHVFPASAESGWLTLSQAAGTGPAQITVQANGAGFGPGAYDAIITIESPGTMPQYVSVPVMFVNGARAGISVTGVSNALSGKPVAAPGMVMSVYGSGLATAASSATTQPLPVTLNGVVVTINGIPTPIYYVSPTQLNIQVPYWVGSGPAVLGVNNNGAVAGFAFSISAAAPALLTDSAGALSPTSTAAQGGLAVLYMTGDGEVTPALKSGYSPSITTAPTSLPKPVQPVNLTVGGKQAIVQFIGITPGVVGLTQVNFYVPPSVATGSQPVVVTVGGVSSPAVNMVVTAAVVK